MARVQIASQGWGFVVDAKNLPKQGATVTLNTTVYQAATGAATLSSAQFVTAADGLLPGFVEEGTYTLTDSDGDSVQVEAVSGATIATLTTGTKGYKRHGDVAATARPSGHTSVEWQGTVEPTNAVDGDTWING